MKTNTITPEQVGALLHGNLVNLAKRVQAGQRLTAGEIRLLKEASSALNSTTQEPAADSKAFVKNKVELAKALGVDRKTINRRGKEPGAPIARADGRHDVAAWRAFLNGDVASGDGDLGSQSELKARQILLQNEKLEFQLEVLRKSYVSFDEVQQWGAQLGASIRNVMCQFHKLAPSLTGCTVEQIEATLKRAEDEGMRQLATLSESMEDWKNAKT